MRQQANLPLSERLAKWQRTWRRIAERVLDEKDDLVQEVENGKEVDDYAQNTRANN